MKERHALVLYDEGWSCHVERRGVSGSCNLAGFAGRFRGSSCTRGPLRVAVQAYISNLNLGEAMGELTLVAVGADTGANERSAQLGLKNPDESQSVMRHGGVQLCGPGTGHRLAQRASGTARLVACGVLDDGDV